MKNNHIFGGRGRLVMNGKRYSTSQERMAITEH